jgi:hypothetical protein
VAGLTLWSGTVYLIDWARHVANGVAPDGAGPGGKEKAK